MKKEEWKDEQAWENDWWGNCANTIYEEQKQVEYSRLMGLEDFNVTNPLGSPGPIYDMQGKKILDIGGGPISLLLRCKNLGKSAVLDPCEYPNWVKNRYEELGIEFIQKPAEEMEFDDTFDEIWFYNVLQHTFDPDEILERCKKYGKTVRFFEWLEKGITKGHPQNLTESLFRKHFGKCGRVCWLGEQKVFAGTWSEEENNIRLASIDKANQNKFRFHLLGLAHLPTIKEISCCAYTQKNLKLAKMLTDLGHDVYFYGVEGSQVECKEMIPCLTEDKRLSVYGAYDYDKNFFKGDGSDQAYQEFNVNAIKEIKKRATSVDFILCSMGLWQKPITDALSDLGMKVVEAGIGYEGVFANFRVYESYAWMHHLYGKHGINDGRFYDTVIPNYFDVDDFPFNKEKEDYCLFIGRLTYRKGLDVAVEATKRAGIKLIVAGQGNLVDAYHKLNITDEHVEHVGSVGPEKRADLMGKAKCVLAPTFYIEPFGGVAVEAQMCGTPTITTDWGAFTETVIHGKTGYRCRTIEEFKWAIKNSDKINPQDCREWAVNNYSIERVGKMYQEYFERLNALRYGGFYAYNDSRKNINSLEKYFV